MGALLAYMYIECVTGPVRGQKTESDTLELELQKVIKCHESEGN